ncbi:MAG: hypothetical protein LBP37_02515 [Spirochaetaceae bacterium]|jgi:hypothetical protein|nr:hypothetical protein [Spirochaetaceae bacterium]
MKRRVGAALTVIYAAALLSCAVTGGGGEVLSPGQPAGEEQYTFHFSGGDIEGAVAVRRDRDGKVTITSMFSGEGYYLIDHEICPLIPEWAGIVEVTKNLKEAVIEGNTITVTNTDDWWEKTVVDGNTTTFINPDGDWAKMLVDGSATTFTYQDGDWAKMLVDGNTTTFTHSDGSWSKTVIDGNTTTNTDSRGSWSKTVKDGNTTTYTNSSGYKEVIDKRGYDIFISRAVK